MASRKYDAERRQIDWSNVPFSDAEISQRFAEAHSPLMIALLSCIGRYSRDHRQVVDTDVVASLKALAESYRTLSSGLYYEKPPDYLYQRELYQELKAALEEFQRIETQRQGLISTRNSDIRDALIYLTRLGAIRYNGRPKGPSLPGPDPGGRSRRTRQSRLENRAAQLVGRRVTPQSRRSFVFIDILGLFPQKRLLEFSQAYSLSPFKRRPACTSALDLPLK